MRVCSGCKGINTTKNRSWCTTCNTAHKREWRSKGKEKDTRKNHRTGTGDVVCTCGSPRYPHRQFSRGCKPLAWVERLFERGTRDCEDCVCREGHECQVVTGVETVFQCPVLREYVAYEEIQLYGAAKRMFERSQGR